MPDTFDVHDHRHRMKQLNKSSETELYENRDGVTCPVCADSFHRVFVLKGRGKQFPQNDGARFCLLNQDSVYLFRH
jgi:hypothetical protein